jgi:tryptophanyl-tRNA synthetase
MAEKKIILTGDRPTGPLHLGHYVGSLQNRVRLQHEYKQFIMIANVQALTDHAENPQKVKDNILEVAMDYLGAGIDPEACTILIQSLIPGLFELFTYYLNLVTVNRLQRNPTVKDEIKQKSFEKHIPAGFLVYPVSQAADITAFKADFVPVGVDQLPMIEQTNEIVRKFNNTYSTNVLVPCKELLSEVSKLPGTDGKAKMSKSLGNAIYLKDDEKTVIEKVKNMYTDPGHIHASDPGKVGGNPVFAYLDAFDPDKKAVEEMKEHYKRGGLGDVVVKKRLTDVLLDFLKPIHGRRKEYEKDTAGVLEILKKGSGHANEVVEATMKEVREAMKMNYF